MPFINPEEHSKYWYFTLFDYTEDDVDKLKSHPEGLQYIIFSKEVAWGIPYLHGTICFFEETRLSRVEELLKNARFSPVVLVEASISFCKAGNFFEVGHNPFTEGEFLIDIDTGRELQSDNDTKET